MTKRHEHRFCTKQYDGGFIAFTRAEPYFCVYGSTEEGAIEAGLSAFDAYFSYKNGGSVPQDDHHE